MILCIAPASCRSLAYDKLVKWMSGTVWLDLTKRCSLRGCNITRSDTITLDVVFAVFRCNILWSASLSRPLQLHKQIQFHVPVHHHRTDVNDLSVSFLDHARITALDTINGAFKSTSITCLNSAALISHIEYV